MGVLFLLQLFEGNVPPVAEESKFFSFAARQGAGGRESEKPCCVAQRTR
jgi:hypothetical protein